MRPTYRKLHKKSKTELRKKTSSFKGRHVGISQGITIPDLENINRVFYLRKSMLSSGKGSWKVVPKDSCEVYKNRRRRQMAVQKNNSKTDERCRCRDRRSRDSSSQNSYSCDSRTETSSSTDDN